MAADKRITSSPIFSTTKLFRVKGSLIGVAGNIEQALRFVEWRKAKSTAEKPCFSEETCFEALELKPDGSLVYWGAEMYGIPIEEDFYAIGTGAPYALGAMAMGANLQKAIQVASRWDTATGNEIQMLNLKEE
jgi:20S proteasome alpha/beta subunit